MQPAPILSTVFSPTVSKYAKASHCQPRKRDYAATAKALDYGQLGLSAAVVRTYRVLCDLDFADRSTGLCKGAVWHATETLAQYLGRSVRTIQRHLVALETAGLVVRKRRQNCSTIVRLFVSVKTQPAPVDNVSPQATKMSFAYKGKKETIKTNNTKQGRNLDALRRYEAKCDAVVTQLIGFGYDVQQAIADFVHFGREELSLQMANLSAYIQAGKVFGSCARWLNWAIRSKHRLDPAQLSKSVPSVTVTVPVSRVEEGYELVCDESGYMTYQPKSEANTESVSSKMAQLLETPDTLFMAPQQENHAMMEAQKNPLPTHSVAHYQPIGNDGATSVGFTSPPTFRTSPAALGEYASFLDHTPTASLNIEMFCVCGQENAAGEVLGRGTCVKTKQRERKIKDIDISKVRRGGEGSCIDGFHDFRKDEEEERGEIFKDKSVNIIAIQEEQGVHVDVRRQRQWVRSDDYQTYPRHEMNLNKSRHANSVVTKAWLSELSVTNGC